MRILIVGAGAVGTVYARHCQLGGARVSFFVKKQYEDACKKGLQFYLLNRPKNLRYQPVSMTSFEVFTELREVTAQSWDYILLAVSSSALQGAWLKDLAGASDNATLVCLQPGVFDQDRIFQVIPASRVIFGMIPIVSYIAPLPGESLSQGTAYWIPPGAAGTMSGPKALVEPLVQLLRKGQFPARVTTNAAQDALVPSVILNLFIAALENEGWSLPQLLKGKEFHLACDAMPEVLQIMSRHLKCKPSWLVRFTFRPFLLSILLRLVLRLSRRMTPFPLDRLLQIHFTKVQEQMHGFLRDYLELSKVYSISAPNLKQLKFHQDRTGSLAASAGL